MRIRDLLPGVEENILLSKYTTFKIGGPALYFFKAKTREDIIGAIKTAKKIKLPFFILGGGSNLLVSDKGFNGLVIKTQNSNVKSESGKISAGAGTSLATLVKIVANKGLSGLEWANGIPGTIGGAVYGNSGAFGSMISDSVVEVEAININSLRIEKLSREECGFGNKESIFKQKKNFIISSVILKLKKGDKKKIGKRMKEFLEHRKKNHPLGFPSGGCAFKNLKSLSRPASPAGGRQAGGRRAAGRSNLKLLNKFPELKEFNKAKMIPVSYLIDKCGLKGRRIGNAKISEKHANFIINLGGAKAEDVKKLIVLVKKEVKKTFGTQIKEEVQFIGF